MKKTLFQKSHILSYIVVAISFLLFIELQSLVFRYDNKYTTLAPYGDNGIFSFTEENLEYPLFLIDGWFLNGEETFIGQYSNYSYLPNSTSPFGIGVYELTLNYEGNPQTLLMEIPEIFTEYTVYVDGKEVATDGKTAHAIPIAVGKGHVPIKIVVENHSHYYSGLTYPPALGTVSQINHLFFTKTLLYSALCFSTFTLALFSMAIWKKREKNCLFLHFGLLCLGFALHLFPKLFLNLGLTGSIIHVIEDVSWLFVLGEALHLSALCIGLPNLKCYSKFLRPITWVVYVFVAISILFIIPQFGGIIKWHGYIIDGYKIGIWLCLTIFSGIGLSQFCKTENILILGITTILGVSLYIDVIDSNRFEPIYGLWQNEYAGILLVLLFGYFMIQKNKTLLCESAKLHELSLQYQYARQSATGMREGIYQVRAMKHDIGKHVTAMSALCQEKDYARLEKYIHSLEKEKDFLPVLLYTNHFLVNAILSSYLNNIKKSGVKVDLNIVLPDELPIEDSDLCALLSNLLSNATEAILSQTSDKPLLLSLRMSIKNHVFTLCIINTSMGEDCSAFFETTKKDDQNHSFGLSIIRSIAEKYNGATQFSRKDGNYTALCALSLQRDLPL